MNCINTVQNMKPARITLFSRKNAHKIGEILVDLSYFILHLFVDYLSNKLPLIVK
ncbi:hypothetical protein CFB3_02290 [Clostridium folliculivorans]|uniref:Uncharacterized protein n=1 Tax=Clostridium folliculivorans TaxID=2886038 RepID=A0A9W5Y3Z9_9CLOT|nr:hypothetical protein CFOLD11_28640 [Clostridium folliculivorans]GKU28123.1 hypothetical protein CFB3_02290 [Clostridium folliculivorans]